MAKHQQILTDFAKITQQLKTWLDENPQIDLMDQVHIENHILLAYELCNLERAS